MVEELAAQRRSIIFFLSLGGAKEGSSQSIFSAGLTMAKSMARTAEMVLTEYVCVCGGCMLEDVRDGWADAGFHTVSSRGGVGVEWVLVWEHLGPAGRTSFSSASY